MIVIKINNVLATRPRAIYLGRRPHRAALILSNLLSVPAKTLSRGRPVTVRLLDLFKFCREDLSGMSTRKSMDRSGRGSTCGRMRSPCPTVEELEHSCWSEDANSKRCL